MAITVQIWMAVNINLLEISFNADDRILAYDAPYDRLRTWSEGGKSGRMFIYFGGLILASYVRSVWQKDDVLRKKFPSTEAVLLSSSPRISQQPAKEVARLSRKWKNKSFRYTKLKY